MFPIRSSPSTLQVGFAGYYQVFAHPRFDYLQDNGQVMEKVEKLAWNYDPTEKGWEWNEELCQDYQRHYPEVIGYEILRPVKRMKVKTAQ